MITDDIEEYTKYSPFMAALAGRDEAARTDIYRRFSALPEEIANILISTDTAEKIESWEKEGIFPPTHSSAVAKLIALAILDIIQPNQIPSLLQKLDLDPAVTSRATETLMTLLGPALGFLEGYGKSINPEGLSTPLEMRPLPPLTTKIPPKPESTAPQNASRNIVDLRQKPPVS